jgi:hypothetical protein
MPLEERLCADEDVVDFLLDCIHSRQRWRMAPGKQSLFSAVIIPAIRG